MSNTNLKTIINLIKSDKLKDRQEGLVSLKDVFERDSAVQNLDSRKDGRAWLVVFQSLFTAVINERATLSRKGSSIVAAERRLKETAAVLRWLVEKSVELWTMKVGMPLLRHILQSIIYNGNLHAPIALDYVKALRVIIAYPPHLDHLLKDRELWTRILSLSFAVVLDDNLENNLVGEAEDNSEAEIESVLSSDEESTSRKRRRTDSPVRKTAKRMPPRTVSPEKIEFVAIIATILQSPRVQLVSREFPHLAPALLERWKRFFTLYYSETSAHLDALCALHATLELLTLNTRDKVIDFGALAWNCLMDLWPTKSRPMKESLLCILKLIFPFVIHEESGVDKAHFLDKLLRTLLPDHNSRSGFEELNLEAIRLRISPMEMEKPFVTKTFRAGYNFNIAQTNAWAVLELLADAVKELYMVSESSHLSTPDPSRFKKRLRLENPVKILLQSATNPRTTGSKAFYLQSLLFVIERHWDVLHAEIQIEIVDLLFQLISVTTEDILAQSWAFCCIAAVAVSDNATPKPVVSSNYWENTWTHAMRRINSSATCRYACHVANAMLFCRNVAMSRILAEVENMLQDINIQGPASPCDSVCSLLASCTRIANQDTSLYQLRLDDKVLSWLVENWNIQGRELGPVSGLSRHHLEQYTMKDILVLIETACGYSNSSHISCPILTALCPLEDTVRSRLDTSVIQTFLLNGNLNDTPEPTNYEYESELKGNEDVLRPPDSRARKISSFFLKTLESTILSWENHMDIMLRLSAETLRRTMDFSVLAICFEFSSMVDGFSNNRRVILDACKVISLIASQFIDNRWSTDELVLLLSSLFPLCSIDYEYERKWNALVSCSKSTGIKNLRIRQESINKNQPAPPLISLIWRSADVQDSLLSVLTKVEVLLGKFISDDRGISFHEYSPLVDNDEDGFAPIRTNDILASGTDSNSKKINPITTRFVSICVDIMIKTPSLRTEKESKGLRLLVDIICSCADDEKFLMALNPMLKHIRRNNPRLSASNLDKLLTRFDNPLQSYKHSHSDSLHVALIGLLDSSSHVWLQTSIPTELAKKVRELYEWLAESLRNNRLLGWKTRDTLGRFLSHYLSLDPFQSFLSDNNPDEPIDQENLPDSLLPLLLKDTDIRVRFTASCACASIFSTNYVHKRDPMLVYSDIREMLCTDLSNYEHMLTRFICLANILIASSAVRRGPYWHLLETCLYTQDYTAHIESVLRACSSRMGLSKFSDLFEAYASQIAYSIRISDQDFFKLPPKLLGYRDLEEYAEATFSAFSPTNLLGTPNDTADVVQGNGPFSRHCRMVRITPLDGFSRCFAEVIGYQIVFWVHDKQKLDAGERVDTSGLFPMLQEKFVGLGSVEFLSSMISQKVDEIMFAILRSGCDLDYHEDGPIFRTLSARNLPEHTSQTFRSLMSFRDEKEFEVHNPNLPAFPTSVVLDSLDWLADLTGSVRSPASLYHILHHFFADVSKCILVNEQIRLLTCLCIWISHEYVLFKNTTLLRVIMTGAATCLSQPELTAISQGMLDWAFSNVRDLDWDCPHLSEILLRTCLNSISFANSSDHFKAGLGKKLKIWLEHQVLSFSQIKIFRRQISISLAAWPCELPEDLFQFRVSLSLGDLSDILDDPYLSLHKFKLVGRLSTLTSYDTHKSSGLGFADHDFWRLKDSIPSTGILYDEVNAFTSLLISHSGRISNKAITPILRRTIGSRFLSLVDSKPDINKGILVKHATVLSLLDLLLDHSASVVYSAYRTLRLIASHESLDSLENVTWPSNYQKDIVYLDFCPINETVRSTEIGEITQAKYLDNSNDFDLWISDICVFLTGVLSKRDPFYAHLFDVLQSNITFSEQIFPVLIYSIISKADESNETQLSMDAQKKLSEYFSTLLKRTDLDVRCQSSIVDLVLFLREFDAGDPKDPLAYNRWLDLDFLLLGRSAIKCGAYTTAILFLELAAEYKKIYIEQPLETEDILYDIYNHIDEPDGFYGIKTQDFQNFLLHRFHHENQWDKAFQFHGADFEAGKRESRLNIVHSLHSFGFNTLAMSTLEATGDRLDHAQSSIIKYQMGWRTGSWDLPEPPDGVGLSSAIYVALRAVCRERDVISANSTLAKCFEEELLRLKRLGDENLIEIRQVIQNLMCLAQIRIWQENEIKKEGFTGYLDAMNHHWKELNTSSSFEFQDLESILATRIALLRSARLKEQRVQIGDMRSDITQTFLQLERECLLQVSEAAREANQPQIALNSITSAISLDKNPDFKLHQEFANVLWLQKEQTFAVKYMKAEISRLENNKSQNSGTITNLQKALALAKLGEWTSEACLEKPEHIDEEYFAPAISLLRTEKHDDHSSNNVRASVFHKCALFAESQYHEITSSEEIRRLHVYSERKSKEIADREKALRDPQNRSFLRELAQHQKRAKVLQAQDTAQLNDILNARNKYLQQAIHLLALCLQTSDNFDNDSATRFCSLWFANFNTEVKDIKASVKDVPSRKFVFLARQLTARLSNLDSENPNQSVLRDMLLRMCSEHPFHSMYQLYSLQSAQVGNGSSRRKSSMIGTESSQADRASAASTLFERLLSIPESAKLAQSLRALCDAYLQWAKYPLKDNPSIKRTNGEPLIIPKTMTIRKIDNLRIPVTTADTPLDPTMRYDNCVWIKGYKPEYTLAGGINLPKICVCIGSDGERYKQLFKGEGDDDLRQDAVMEQVFELCNQVLTRDQQTRKRDLRIRSYKVIPLAPQAGLLEFVGNTTPLHWVTKAHAFYHPDDYYYRNCSMKLSNVRKENEGDPARLRQALIEAFKTIRKHFRPVMRHFFTEKHKNPQLWFEMRLKYSRSVAATSIVGHILGLGDRHLSNILIDQGSGEVVHIDLGIAFEQGKLLPIPERVPFRLTADIVDGFGISGTDGVFRRCSEETLRVLRDGSDVIKTVLEVFKHDPLHSWTVSAMKIRKAQADTGVANQQSEADLKGTGIGLDMSSGVEAEAADRALNGVARKLDKSLSVEYTVNELIFEATDITNLALMFAGWSPFC